MRVLLHKRTDTIVPLKICIWQFLSKAVLLQVIEYFSLQPGICRFGSMRIVELQTLLSSKAFEKFTLSALLFTHSMYRSLYFHVIYIMTSFVEDSLKLIPFYFKLELVPLATVLANIVFEVFMSRILSP